MLLGAVAQAQNFAITATTEAAIRKNIVKGNAANYGFGVINDTLKLVGLTTRNVIFTGSTSKTDIGLGNVDNTSDANKPVSTATQTALNLKQNQLNGTGFVKATGTTISYDNSTYLSTSTAASTYLPISNPTATGTLTAPTIANTLGATFATSSGNVGIGTTSPATKLHVEGTGYTTALIRSSTTTAGGLLTLSNTARSYSLGARGDYGTGQLNILDETAGLARFSIFSTGNVGIGTTTDAGIKLDVVGNIRATTGYLLDGATDKTLSIQTALNNRVFFGGWQNGAYMTSNRNPVDGAFTDVAKAAAIIAVTGTSSDSNIEFRTTATNNTLPGVRMYINKDGNVAIGTTSPNASSILDITSTTKGVLFPRMTTAQINDIASPADGLTVYNTTLKVICFYDSSAAVWKKVSHSNM